ncbi:MAG: serine/threonine protein phosphatase [Bacteroides sp.]|nr:serine/threonine protein phosphatase [Bacteroides sp.]
MMKRILLSITALLALGQAYAQKGEPQIPVYPALEDAKSFSMIMVPDPQSYVKFAANQPLFDLQTAWIAQNQNRLNIKAALFTGDMVEQNNKLISAPLPNEYNGDQTSRQQWEAVSRALDRLDNRLPYVVCQGNHDLGYIAAEYRYSMMPDFIYPERNSKFAQTLVATGPNYQGIHTMENAAFEFCEESWGKLLVIALEFAPRDEALDWARQLIESDRFKNHRVFIFVHSFLNTAGERIQTEGYKLAERNWAQAVWEKLIYPSKNIQMVLCGHTGAAPNMDDLDNINYKSTSSFRIDKAADGHSVVQMMFNSQQGDGDWNGNGGDCWLRILEFKPDGKTIGVRTFSPLFALSKRTQHMAWRTADYDQFLITLE